MEKTHLIEYLRNKADGSDLMNPKQLQSVVGIPTKRQSELRRAKNFPIAYKTIGRLVFYSIYAVAEFLFDTDTQQEKPQQKQSIKEPSRKTSTIKFRREPQDLSKIIMLKTLLDNMKKEREILENLVLPVEKFIDAKSLFEELQKDLC